jgi:uncharacterized membrane protein (DUF2068 family)
MQGAPRRGLVLIGVLKLLKGAGLLVIGVTLLSHWLELLRFDVHARLVESLLGRVAELSPRAAREAGGGALLYGAVFCIEGTGLLLGKPWAEYMTTGVTASFLPLEAYELVKHPSLLKAVVFSINIVIVVYLLHEIRRRRRGVKQAS